MARGILVASFSKTGPFCRIFTESAGTKLQNQARFATQHEARPAAPSSRGREPCCFSLPDRAALLSGAFEFSSDQSLADEGGVVPKGEAQIWRAEFFACSAWMSWVGLLSLCLPLNFVDSKDHFRHVMRVLDSAS